MARTTVNGYPSTRGNDESGVYIERVEAATALLGNLDKDDDRAAIEDVAKAPTVWSLPRNQFDTALTHDKPVFSSYFANAASGNQVQLQVVNQVVMMAFFTLLGVISLAV